MIEKHKKGTWPGQNFSYWDHKKREEAALNKKWKAQRKENLRAMEDWNKALAASKELHTITSIKTMTL